MKKARIEIEGFLHDIIKRYEVKKDKIVLNKGLGEGSSWKSIAKNFLKSCFFFVNQNIVRKIIKQGLLIKS